jgi:ferredoxin-fold anticodon binding domain-containing protein
LKEIGDRKKEIKELENQIGKYVKIRATYAAYKKNGFDRAFYDANVDDIMLHKAAKKYFNEHNHKGKLPSIKTLKTEWDELEKYAVNTIQNTSIAFF